MRKKICSFIVTFLFVGFASFANATIIDFEDLGIQNGTSTTVNSIESSEFFFNSSYNDNPYNFQAGSLGFWPLPGSTVLSLSTYSTLTFSSKTGNLFSLLSLELSDVSTFMAVNARGYYSDGSYIDGTFTRIGTSFSYNTFSLSEEWKGLTTVSLWSGNPVWYLDNISVTSPVPEPASILLFGTGIIGFAGRRLRRKTKNS